MAIKIQTPDVARRVARFFGIRGKYLPQVEEFIVPTILIGDLSVAGPPPIARHASCAFSITGVAARYSTVRLIAPIGVLCVLTDVYMHPQLTSYLTMGLMAGGAAPALVPTFTDTRLVDPPRGSPETPAALVSSEARVAILTPISWRAYAVTGFNNHYQPRGWVIGPARAGVAMELTIQLNGQDNDANGSIEWDEYPLD